MSQPVDFLVDTGSTVCLLNHTVVQKLGLCEQMISCDFNRKCANGEIMSVKHYVRCPITVQNMEFVCHFLVSEKIDFPGIFGMDAINRIGLKIGIDVGLIFSISESIVKDYSDVFDKPMKNSLLCGVPPVEIIKLAKDARPKQCVVRPLSKEDAQFMQLKVNELLENGVIRPSQSPWRHQPIVVPKDGGKSKRLVINYKPLNELTTFDAYPFPPIEELFEKIGSATVFTKIDFNQFYHQLPLLESDIPKTAFHCNGELYEYTRCPFGLKNAVAYCFRVLKEVLKECSGVVLYLDDVCVYGSDQEEHDRKLSAVFAAIRKHGLSVNYNKCSFSQKEVHYLGFIFKDGTKRPDPSRFESVIDFPLPTDAKSLQRFLGMVGFFSNFIDHYSNIVAPLFDKLKFFTAWTREEIKLFEKLKSSITTALLYVPQPDETLHLYTDASNECISGVLVNVENRPVQYCSRKLNEAEKRYDIVEKEALAIYWSIMRCRTFLLGRKFVVFSDHKPLEYIFNNPREIPKVIRWRLQLLEFDFKVQYLKGKENVAADCLSRINAMEFDDNALLIDENEVKEKQKFCKETSFMKTAIEKNYKRKPRMVSQVLWSLKKHCTVRDGILYVHGKLFVPYSLRLKVLTIGHGCHLGRDATFERVKSLFFWPGLSKEVGSFVAKCRICSLVKPRYYDPLLNPLIAKAPFECLAIDHIGPLPPSQGYRYLLVMIDMYSRYPFVFPVKSLGTVEVTECLKKVFAMFGYPDSILSDRGTAFESNDFQNFCTERKIVKKRTTAYNPKGNSICERFNQTLKGNLFKILVDRNLEKSYWLKFLDLALFEYRTSVHATTGFRPVDLLFNFNCRGFLPYKNDKNTNSAVENMLQNRMSAKPNYDGKRCVKSVCFKPGEEVLLKSNQRATFDRKGTIVRVVADVSDEVTKIIFPNGKIDTVNKSRLAKLGTGGPKCGNKGQEQKGHIKKSSFSSSYSDSSDYAPVKQNIIAPRQLTPPSSPSVVPSQRNSSGINASGSTTSEDESLNHSTLEPVPNDEEDWPNWEEDHESNEGRCHPMHLRQPKPRGYFYDA